MDRREALKTTSLLLGFSVSASAVAAVMQGCVPERVATSEWKPVFFNEQEVTLVAELAETILPKTETPGAKDAFVHRYIDLMLKDHYNPTDHREFRNGLKMVRAQCQERFGKKFETCSSDERQQLLEDVEKESGKMTDTGTSALVSRPFFHTLKELTYIGYFTSELIGEEYLNYDPIPGQYDGCMPLADIGNAWSL